MTRRIESAGLREALAWTNVLPDDWESRPLRAVADYVVSNVDKIVAEDEYPVRLCNYTDVYNSEFLDLHGEYLRATATEAEIKKFGLAVGDVIITKDSEAWDDIAVPALVRQTSPDFLCGYHLAVLRPHEGKMHGPFLLRCLQSKPIRLQFALAARGVTRFGLPKSEIGNAVLPVPPLPKQRAIADFLDQETARLDSLVAEKERLLGLLDEKRGALSAQATTRGLHPDVPFRDSGVSWLGPIPEHWDTERARWIFRERDQRSATGAEELLTVSHLTGVTPRSEKEVNMFEAETLEGYKICLRGDLVINTLWAWMGAMGVAFVDGIVSPAYNVYAPHDRMDPLYVDTLVRLRVFAQEATRYSMGVWSSRLRLYPEGFFAMTLPVPPLAEQREIAGFLEAEGRNINVLREATLHAIELLKERRDALIAAAIAGCFEVEAQA